MLRYSLAIAILFVTIALAEDPTSYLHHHPPREARGCGVYNVTTEAWQTGTCTYVVKYSINGKPGVSNWGVPLSPSLGDTRTISVSGCSTQISSSGGNSPCDSYAPWEASGSLVKVDSSTCDQVADFWLRATLVSLGDDGKGEIALKGSTSCWSCSTVPYYFVSEDACLAMPSPSVSASASPSTTISASPSASHSAPPSRSAKPSPLAGGSGDTTARDGAIAGGVIGGIAALGAIAAIVAGAAYVLYRAINRNEAPGEIASALDTPADASAGVNVLFVDNSAMQPNPVFNGGV